MSRCEAFTAESLPLDVREAWLDAQSKDARIASPYFTLGFAEAMACVRADVRVLVQFDAGAPTAILPVHKGFLGHARPLGGPLGDHHGVIHCSDHPVHLRPMLAAAGVQWFDFFGAVLLDDVFRSSAQKIEGSWVIDLADGFDDYLARRTEIEPKAFRNLRARSRKIDTAGYRFCLDDRRDAVFEQALAWKSAQYRASGQFDIFQVSWTRELFTAMRKLDRADCQLFVSSLEIDGALAAAHVGMKSQQALHYWFPSYDPAQSRYGPGLALLMQLAKSYQDGGFTQIHLGPGDYGFKAELSNSQIPLGIGYVAAGPAALGRAVCSKVESWSERARLGRVGAWPGKAFRRIDKIAGFHAA